MIAVIVSVVAAVCVFVLPGFGAKAFCGRISSRHRSRTPAETAGVGVRPVEMVVHAVAWSVIVLSVFGAVLIGAGVFHFWILGIGTALIAIAGLPSFIGTLRSLRRELWVGGCLALLSTSFIWTALRTNLTPTHSYAWYYWDLGRQLDIAGGVPKSVLEFGLAERWHPDYVLAVIVTGAYHALAFPLSETEAIVAYRVPIFLLAATASYLVFRLWVRKVPALIGVAVASATTLFITKFASYKPETLAFGIGLLATWILIDAIRRRSRGSTLLAGGLFGVAVGMHGVAATVTAMLALSAALVELRRLAPSDRKAMFFNAVRAVVLTGVVVIATGLSLQGRAVVATDAGHPKLEHGEDPTWVFLNRDDGTFYDPPQPSVGSQAAETLRHPWPGGIVGSWGWIVGAVAVLTAVALALRRPGLRRAAALSLLGTVALIGVAMLFFGLKYHTFIPQHTGLTRIAIYLGLVDGLGIAIGADLIADKLLDLRLDAVQVAAVGVACLVFVSSWAIGVSVIALNKYGGIGAEGRQALAVLKKAKRGRDEAVLSNVSTRGLIGFTTGLQAPIEGRQPVIEDAEFLAGANRALVEIHHYFNNPESPTILRRMGVRWLLISNGSRGFGSPFVLGPPSGEVPLIARQPYADEVWHAPHLALFKVRGPVAKIEPVAPRKTLELPVALALLAVGSAIFLLTRERPWVPWQLRLQRS